MILVDKHYAPIRRTSQQNTCADLQQRVPVRFLPIAINHSNRIISAIRPHITSDDALTGGHIYVGRDEAADFGVVVAGGEIVEAGFGIVVITAITERVVRAKCSCQGAGGGYQLAPRIVDIFYHTHAAFVHKAHYIILAVSQIIVLRAVVVHGYRLAVGIVAEQQRFSRRYLRHEQTAVVAERCGHSVYCLARAYALFVIGVACGQTVAG